MSFRFFCKFPLLLASLLAGLLQQAHASGDPARGEYIFHAGNCVSCHTAKDSARLAGGHRLNTPFGTFVVPNITPDTETGIGGWSGEDFRRAMAEGISPDGRPYYPSFPFTSYMRLTDRDLRDLKAWLDTVPPVRNATEEHDLKFPFNIRTGLWAWRLVYFNARPFTANAGKSAEWNRGAYLVTAAGHCGECHSPRNFAGVVDDKRALAGTKNGPDGKPVPGLRQGSDIGDWSVNDIVFALQLGLTPDGDSLGGAMADVIEHNTGKLTDTDLRAIVIYLKSLPVID